MPVASRRLGPPLLAAAALAAIAACGDDGPTAPSRCRGFPNVSVGAGPLPTFAWTPACAVHRLDVVELTPRMYTLAWSVGSRANSRNDVVPPRRYGEGSPASGPGAPTPLVPGRRYRVELVGVDPKDCDILFTGLCREYVAGSAEFVP